MSEGKETSPKAPKATAQRAHSDVIINKALTKPAKEMSPSEARNTYKMAIERATNRGEFGIVAEIAKKAEAANK